MIHKKGLNCIKWHIKWHWNGLQNIQYSQGVPVHSSKFDVKLKESQQQAFDNLLSDTSWPTLGQVVKEIQCTFGFFLSHLWMIKTDIYIVWVVSVARCL